eukprot:373680-Hanusia_phi.AAC.5
MSREQMGSNPLLFSNGHVLSFSARGPCQDGRLKPDVVLPGLVHSARSNGRAPNINCCLHALCNSTSSCPKDCSSKGSCREQGEGNWRCLCEVGFCGSDCSLVNDRLASSSCCPFGPSPSSTSSSAECGSLESGNCENLRSSADYMFESCACRAGRVGNDCSMAANDKLATLTKMGTSMSTPVAAGLAVLARSYLGEVLSVRRE